MPILEIANVRSSDGEAFAVAVERSAAILREAPGCGGVDVQRCIERPEEFTLLVEWTSVAAHEEFRASELFSAYRAPIAELFAEPPSFAHFTRILLLK